MKLLRTIIILAFTLVPLCCDFINNIIPSCDEYDYGWIKFENLSDDCTYKISFDGEECTLSLGQTSDYYKVNTSISWLGQSINWFCIEKQEFNYNCTNFTYLSKCEYLTISCP
jgi:hypothetical protein